MIAASVTLSWFIVFCSLAAIACFVGALVHPKPREKSTLFWLDVGLLLFILAFLIQRAF